MLDLKPIRIELKQETLQGLKKYPFVPITYKTKKDQVSPDYLVFVPQLTDMYDSGHINI